MRLVQLAAYDGAYPGSSVPMMHAALVEARQRGWDAEAVYAETAREQTWLGLFAEEGLPVRIVERAARRSMAGELERLLDEQPETPTILHTHFTAYDVPAVIAAHGRPHVRVLWHMHTPPEQRLRVRLRTRVKMTRYGPLTSAILCVAPHMAESIGALAPPGRTHFFPNGIDTGRFRPASPEERRRARAELGLPADGVLLAHLGWDWQVKGGDLLLDAVARLRDDGVRVHVVTRAGDVEEARADVAARELQEQVTVLEQLERIQLLYDGADAFVSSSRKEGMPFAVLEALLSGLPVVATDIVGHHLIADRYPGCRIVAGDGAGIAAGIAELLEADQAVLAEQTATAHRMIVDSMSLKAWTERLFGLYDEIVAAG